MPNGEKFDCIVGNPPYQNPKNGTRNLWPYFVELGIKILKPKGYLAFITPTTWMRPSNDIVRRKDLGGKLSILKDIMHKYRTIFINISESLKEHFKVGSTISWYIIQNIENKDITKFKIEEKEINIDIKKFNIFPNTNSEIIINIFEKMQTLKTEFFNFKSKNQKILFDRRKIKDNEYRYKYVGSQYNRKDFNANYGCMMRFSNKKHPDYNLPKIIINYIGKIVPYIDNGDCGMSYCLVHYLKNKNECEGAKDLFNSKLFKLFFKYVRYGMHNEVGVFNALPKLDLTRSWTDAEIYDHFKLTKAEIKYINKK